MIGKVDIVAKVEGGGFTGKSGAIRFGIATALTSFVDQETAERMRIGEFELLYVIINDCDRCRCRCRCLVDRSENLSQALRLSSLTIQCTVVNC